MIDLTTLARVKAWLKISTPDNDVLIGQIITGISEDFEVEMGRHTEKLARTELYDSDDPDTTIFLKGFPVETTPVPVFKTAIDGDFAAQDPLIDGDDFHIDLERGIFQVRTALLQPGPGNFQAVYTGGMAVDTTAFIAAFPNIANLMDIQVAFFFQRKDQLGLTGFSGAGGSVTQQLGTDLLPYVEKRLIRHARVAAEGPS